MRIASEHYFPGPSIFLPVSAMALLLEDLPDGNPGDMARLRGAVEKLRQVSDEIGTALDKALAEPRTTRLPWPAIVAELVARTAISLQRSVNANVRQTGAARQPQPGQVAAIFECGDVLIAELAGRAAVDVWNAVLTGNATGNTVTPALDRPLADFGSRATDIALHYDLRLVLAEAQRRNIPWFRVHQGLQTVQLGQGIHQKRFAGIISGETSEIAITLSAFKNVTADILRRHGLPVPEHALTLTEEQALQAARRMGFPVVVKPANQDKGIGVRVGIMDESELREAFAGARQLGGVLVEKQIAGFDNRFTFVKGKLAGVLQTLPPLIVGDGQSSVQALIDRASARVKIVMDDEVHKRLQEEGCTLDDVPASGRRIVLRKWWRNGHDYILRDVTAEAHPVNIEAARLAVQIVGLDLAGVDFMSPDITRPFHENGGAINEVNPRPAIGGAVYAGLNIPRAVLEGYFPVGENGRVPTVAVGGAALPGVGETIADMLNRAGHVVGVDTPAGIAVGNAARPSVPGSSVARAQAILNDPETTAAILRVTWADVVDEGLGFDQCDIALIGLGDANDSGAVQRELVLPAAAVLAGAGREMVILDAEDPRSLALLPRCTARRICWLFRDRPHPAVAERVGLDGLEVTVRSLEGSDEPQLVIVERGRRMPVVPASALRSPDRADPAAQLRLALATCAIAYGLKVPIDVLADTLAGGR